MDGIYLNPRAIGYFIQAILAGVIAGYLIGRRTRSHTVWCLAILFANIALTDIFYTIEAATLDIYQRLSFALIGNFFATLGHVALFHFSYIFPEPSPLQARERKIIYTILFITLPLSMGLVWYDWLYMRLNGLAAPSSSILALLLIFLPHLILYFGTPLIFWRRISHFSAPGSWFKRTFYATEPFARGLRSFGLFFIFYLGVILAGILRDAGLIGENYGFNVAGLAVIFLLAIVTFEHLPERTSIVGKFLGIVLLTTLTTLAITSAATQTSDEQLYQPSRPYPNFETYLFARQLNGYTLQKQTIQFANKYGTPLDFSSQKSQLITLPFVFPFFNKKYTEIYVNSNGSLTFNEPYDINLFVERLQPTIAPMLMPLAPEEGGQIYVDLRPEEALFTWHNVPEKGQNNKNSFQISLRPGGFFLIHYAGLYPQTNFHARYEENSAWATAVLPGDARTIPQTINLLEENVQFIPSEGFIDNYYADFRLFLHYRLLIYLPLTLILTVFIMEGLPFFLRSSLIIPMSRLLTAVKKVNEGDLTVNAPVSGDDEIAFLTQSFNQMVYSIRRSQEALLQANLHLEQRVQERTQALNEQIVEREKLIAELDAFAHTVAHDLKTPLTSIVAYAELLQHEHPRLSPAEMAYFLELLGRGGHRLRRIVDSLLFLAFARDGEVALAPLPMPELVEDVLDRLKPLLEQGQAQIILPAEWPAALGHAPWIEEVWMNYASNALKYGGKPPLLHFGYDLQEKGVRFWLKDNGPGLTLQEQQNVFTPFTRLNQAKLEGHGLGLSIVQRVIQKLGGEVGVESSDGQGCLFYFTLPATDEKKEAS